MFKVTKIDENGILNLGEFKFETEEEAEGERRKIIEEEGLSELDVIVESEEDYNESRVWADDIS